jgi:hypothetical protein
MARVDRTVQEVSVIGDRRIVMDMLCGANEAAKALLTSPALGTVISR